MSAALDPYKEIEDALRPVQAESCLLLGLVKGLANPEITRDADIAYSLANLAEQTHARLHAKLDELESTILRLQTGQ